MEKCGNCETSIGNFETPCLWNETVVCAGCYEKLKQQSARESAEALRVEAARASRANPIAEWQASIPEDGLETPRERVADIFRDIPVPHPAALPLPPSGYSPNMEKAVTYGILKAIVVVFLLLSILALGIIILEKANN